MFDGDDGVLSGRYRLGDRLGRGAVAEVFRAHDLLLERPVAVKLFRSHPDLLARRRFDHESQALAALSHPGLVSIFDVGVHHDRLYLVMRLVDGGSLQARLLDGPLTPAHTVRLGSRLAGGLAHVHARGVVHRDVKPSNILLDEHGEPCLTDFGIALVTGAARLTASNEIIGTPAYLAPEQVSGTVVTPAVDVYALGLVLLECLTGEVEYPGDNRMEAALARLHRPPRIPAGLPRDVAGLLMAMTAPDPASRPTAAACADHLAALAELPADWRVEPRAAGSAAPWWADPKRTVVDRPHRSSAHRRWAPVAAASLLGAAAAVGVVLMLVSPQTPNAGAGQARTAATSATSATTTTSTVVSPTTPPPTPSSVLAAQNPPPAQVPAPPDHKPGKGHKHG